MLRIGDRIFYGFGGLFGAAGISAFAASAHIGGYYGTVAPILLGNGAVLIALAVSARSNLVLRLAGGVVILGVLLFSCDIMVREIIEGQLFPYAAPLGGTINIFGWLFFVIAAFMPRKNFPEL